MLNRKQPSSVQTSVTTVQPFQTILFNTGGYKRRYQLRLLAGRVLKYRRHSPSPACSTRHYHAPRAARGGVYVWIDRGRTLLSLMGSWPYPPWSVLWSTPLQSTSLLYMLQTAPAPFLYHTVRLCMVGMMSLTHYQYLELKWTSLFNGVSIDVLLCHCTLTCCSY